MGFRPGIIDYTENYFVWSLGSIYIYLRSTNTVYPYPEKSGWPIIIERGWALIVIRWKTVPGSLWRFCWKRMVWSAACPQICKLFCTWFHPTPSIQGKYFIRIRTRGGIYGQKYPSVWRSSRGQSLRELLKAEGYIWLYILSRVLIRTLYHFNNY